MPSPADQINLIGNNLRQAFASRGQQAERMAGLGLAGRRLGAELQDRELARPVAELGAMRAKREMDTEKAPVSIWDVIPNADVQSLEHSVWEKDPEKAKAEGVEPVPSLFGRTLQLTGTTYDTDPKSPTYKRLLKQDGTPLSRGEFTTYAPQVARMYFMETDPARARRAQYEKLQAASLAGGPEADKAKAGMAEIEPYLNTTEGRLKDLYGYRDYISQFSGPDVDKALARVERNIAGLEGRADKAMGYAREDARDERKFRREKELKGMEINAQDRRWSERNQLLRDIADGKARAGAGMKPERIRSINGYADEVSTTLDKEGNPMVGADGKPVVNQAKATSIANLTAMLSENLGLGVRDDRAQVLNLSNRYDAYMKEFAEAAGDRFDPSRAHDYAMAALRDEAMVALDVPLDREDAGGLGEGYSPGGPRVPGQGMGLGFADSPEQQPGAERQPVPDAQAGPGSRTQPSQGTNQGQGQAPESDYDRRVKAILGERSTAARLGRMISQISDEQKANRAQMWDGLHLWLYTRPSEKRILAALDDKDTLAREIRAAIMRRGR